MNAVLTGITFFAGTICGALIMALVAAGGDAVITSGFLRKVGDALRKEGMTDKIIFEDGKEMGCDGKNCYEIHYRINPATHEWEVTGGKCRQCGSTFIV